jgi:adenosylcobinamide hydrolase
MIILDLNTHFDKVGGNTVAVIRLSRRMRVLSSALMNGGETVTDTFLFMQVPKGYDNRDPLSEITEVAKALGLPDSTVGFMTAAKVDKVFQARHGGYNGAQATAAVTAGVCNAVTAGELIEDIEAILRPRVGTINIVAISNSSLSKKAMVNAVMTVTEAKAAALRDVGIEGTGTTSDSMAIVCPEGEGEEYCGTATDIGIALARAVRTAVADSIMANGDRPRAYDIFEVLKDHDISEDDLWGAAVQLYYPNPEWDTKALEGMFRDALRVHAKDVNVNSMLLAASRLERDGGLGMIGNLPRDMFEEDPVHLVADEMLGIALSQYIAGTRGLFEYTRYDKKKPGVIGTLGPFMDDIVGALIGGIMSSLYTRLLEDGT